MEFLLWLVATIISIALQPKPEEPSPASLGDIQVPTADPNRYMAVLFGLGWSHDMNVGWYGNLDVDDIKGDGGLFHSDPTIGFRYSLSVHASLGYPVDEIREIRFNKKTAWIGSASDGLISINRQTLFGDKDREGGVKGTISIIRGDPAQAVDDHLVQFLGPDIPAFRGAQSVVFRGFYFGNSKSIPRPSFLRKRINIQTDFTPQWYPAKADINDNLNAAHILRECCISNDWGMGYPSSQVDDASFAAAADTLYDEGYGLSMRWTGADSIQNFMATVENHIGGTVNTDPSTGLFTLTLTRDDYTPSQLLLLDESNSKLGKFGRRGWGETVNEITVSYHEPVSDLTLPVTVQDTGNIQIQGAVVSETINLPGIPNGSLASRVAKSILRIKSAPLSSIELHDVSRVAYQLTRGSVFRYSNARLGLDQVVYRVTNIKRGSLTDGGITLSATEDVFSLDTNSYVDPQPTGWISPNTEPAPLTVQRVLEASYWDVQKNMTPADISFLSPNFGFLLAQAVKESSDSYNYQIHSKRGADPYVKHGTGLFAPSAQLDGAMPVDGAALTARVVPIKAGTNLDRVVAGTYAYINDECVAITAIDTELMTITIDHGVLDTVPVDHMDSERIWFAEDHQGADLTEWADADVVDAKLLPQTTLGTLDIDAATALQLTMANRYDRPFPPGNIKINTINHPSKFTGDLVITGSHRDRTQQLDALHVQNEGDIGPEAGTTYDLLIFDETGAIYETHADLASVSHTLAKIDDILKSGLVSPAPDRLLVLSGGSAYASVITADAPVGWWRLGESSGVTAVDEIAANNGTYTNTPTLGVGGLLHDDTDTAVSFNPASSEYVTMGDVLDFERTDPFSLECWVKVAGTAANQVLISKQDNSSPFSGYGLFYDTDDKLQFLYRNDANSSIQVSTAAALGIADGKAHYILLTYDGSSAAAGVTISVDDDVQALTTISDTLDATTLTAHPFQLSGRDGGNLTFDGVMDEAAIYDYELSQADASLHYTTGAGVVLTDQPRANGKLRVTIESKRDGLVSYQKQNIALRRRGWGYNYGSAWGD